MAKVKIVVEVEVSGGATDDPEAFDFVSLKVGDDAEAFTLPAHAPAPRPLARALAVAAGKGLQKPTP